MAIDREVSESLSHIRKSTREQHEAIIANLIEHHLPDIARRLATAPGLFSEMARHLAWTEPEVVQNAVQILVASLDRRNAILEANKQGILARTILYPDFVKNRRPPRKKGTP